MSGTDPEIDASAAADRFEVRGKLGAGGMGEVYRVFDRQLGREVALKVLRSISAPAQYRFKREFRALVDIVHPNLITLHELHTSSDEWFFTMDLVEGVPFIDWVRPRGAAPARDAEDAISTADQEDEHGEADSNAVTGDVPLRFKRREQIRAAAVDEARLRGALAQLVDAVLALHSDGKLHRDLKPSNVLVTGAGRVVVLDFGLVAEVDPSVVDRTHEASAVGTPSYMSPEQAADRMLTPATDWYSVGAMLFEALTGRRPFEGAPEQVLLRKQRERAPRPSELAPDVPADLDALCVAMLARAPEARPDGRAILAALGVASSPATDELERLASASAGPFVGRAAELAELASARVTAPTRGVAVFVGGDSGVGKSQLVRRALQEVRADTLVLEGRCLERESVPFKALDAVVDALAGALLRLPERRLIEVMPPEVAALARLFPVLRRVPMVADRCIVTALPPDPHELRRRAFAALRYLLRSLAWLHPVVIWIDDLHWGDADSAVFLADLVHAPEPLLLLFTHRLEDDAGIVGAVRDRPAGGGGGDVRTLTLGRLGNHDSVTLAHALLEAAGRGDPGIAAAVAQEAAGHPFFLDELVRHVRLRGGPAPARISLDDVFHARIAELAEAPRRLLEVLAVAGIALSQATVMHAADLSRAEFATHVRALRLGHLVRSSTRDGEAIVETYHDRVREAVVSRTAPGPRRACHQRIARALEATARHDVDALATQWLAAGDVSAGLAYLLEAADQAHRSLAFDRAARLYERALGLFGAEVPERQLARIRLAEAHANAGRGAEAARAFAEAAAHAPAEHALDLRRLQAEHLLNAGRFDEGEAVMLEVLAAVGLRMPRSPTTAILGLLRGRARLWVRGLEFEERAAADVPRDQVQRLDVCGGVATLLGAVDTVRAAHFQTKTLLLALEAGEPGRIARALAVEGAVRSIGGPRSEAMAARSLDRAMAIADRLGNSQLAGAVLVARSFSAFLHGRFRDAHAHSARGVEVLRERSDGAFWEMRTGEMVRLWSLTWLGELAELGRQIDRFVASADARGDLHGATSMRAGSPGIAWLRGDDPVAARKIIEDAMRLWTQRGYHNQHYWSTFAEVQVDLYEGEGAAALQRLAASWPRMKRSFMLEVQVIRLEATFARARAAILAAAAADTPARARKLRGAAARDARTLARSDVGYGAAMAQLIVASLAVGEGREEAAVAALGAAVHGFAGAGMRLYEEAARWRLGQRVGGREGRAGIDAAERWARDQGVANPARMLAMCAPGFVAGDGARRLLAAG